MARVLIVEDTASWREYYVHKLSEMKHDVNVAATLSEARDALGKFLFAAGIIDIRLDESDEHNIDGLRVLDYATSTGDGTAAIVVTGHGTLRIAREALLRYGAYDVLDKDQISPDVVSTKISGAIEQFQQKREQFLKSQASRDALRGSLLTIWEWEWRLMEHLDMRPINVAYALLDKFMPRVAPLIQVARDEGKGLSFVSSPKLGCGVFWSKALGLPVLVAMGQAAEIDKVEHGAEIAGLESIRSTSVVVRCSVSKVAAVALRAEEMTFADFSAQA